MRGVDPEMRADRAGHVSGEAQLDCSAEAMWPVSENEWADARELHDRIYHAAETVC